MQWRKLRPLKERLEISRSINLEAALNNEDLLKSIFRDTMKEMGITESQKIAIDMFSIKQGKVIMYYAERKKLGNQAQSKILGLVRQWGGEETERILAHTAICLMEKYGILKGGPKLP